jgi:ribosome-binding protein aMBF1 (putative translation factor)
MKEVKNMTRKTHEQLVKQTLKKPVVKKVYDELEAEFSLLRSIVSARRKAGKTQEEVAKAMGTTTSVVGRLEAAGAKKRRSPTLAALRKYAHAINCDLQIRFVHSHR